MAKALKKFNGRAYCLVKHDDPVWQSLPDKVRNRGEAHGYIAAYSRADACRMINEYLGRESKGLDNELKNYWHEGTWGNAMEGVAVERGIWLQADPYGPEPKLVRIF